MSSARFNADGEFKVQADLLLKRLEDGTVALIIYANGKRMPAIIIQAQDWVDGTTSVTPDAKSLSLVDWQLRALHAGQLFEARGGFRSPPPVSDVE